MLERTRLAFPKSRRLALLAMLLGLAMAALNPSPPDAMAKPRARAEPQFDFFDIFRPPPQQRTRRRRARPKDSAKPSAARQKGGTPGRRQPAAGKKLGKMPRAKPARPVAAPRLPTPSIAPPSVQPVAPPPVMQSSTAPPAAAPAAVPQAALVGSRTMTRRGTRAGGQAGRRAALPPRVPFPPARPGTRATHEPPPAKAPAQPSVAGAPPAQLPPKPEPKGVAMPVGPLPASACMARLKADRAIVRAEPQIDGPGGCGMSDAVELEAIVMADGSRATLAPPAMLRCDLAERLVNWVRDDVDGMLRKRGNRLTKLQVMGSYECRGRNRAVGGRLSQHGLGNAIDIGTLTLTERKTLDPVDIAADKEVRLLLRASACNSFTTVLGPGSDGFHENHIHLDFTARRGGYRICHWDVK